MKKVLLIWQLLLPAAHLLSGQQSVCGNRPVIKMELSAGHLFSQVQIDGDVSIILTNAAPGAVIAEGKETDLTKINFLYDNDRLIIDAHRKHLFTKLTIYISAIHLQSLQLNGDGNITSNELIQAAHLHLSLNGNIGVKIRTYGKISFEAPGDIELRAKPAVILSPLLP